MAAVREVLVPDIGDFKDIPVIEVMVKPGDRVKAEETLVTLESDKATMDVPAPFAGVVKELKIKLGDKVSEGTAIVVIEADAGGGAASAPAPAPVASAPAPTPAPAAAPAPVVSAPPPAAVAAATTIAPSAIDEESFRNAHASPAVRLFARELGVDLGKVKGAGPKGRVLKEDIQSFVKTALNKPAASASGGGLGFNLPAMPVVDFSKFGVVETKPLSRIKKISGANLHRNWISIPHITQDDEIDITEMEAFRKQLGDEMQKSGVKVTPLAFLLKAAVAALRKFPHFNASLAPDGESLILKRYFHIGVAVDTPNGLVVPVIRNVDQKGIMDLAKELGEVSARARDGKLGPAEMQGGCFSISSLGGIGGTHFTPIINAPEVAILGVARSAMRPVWRDNQFVPRLILPVSLSYDHRVIDGAEGARFVSYLNGVLSDIRRLLI